MIKSLFGDAPLFRKVMASIMLASVFFLSVLSIVVYYSNEIIEDALLAKQTEFERQNIQQLLIKEPDAALPRSASLNIYLASRQATHPIPKYLLVLDEGIHHDIKIADKAYHVLVAPQAEDRIYIQFDITEIERSEALLKYILLVAWIVLIVILFFIARILSKSLSRPIAQLNQALSGISPDERGIRLSERFEDDEVGKIAQAFDAYTVKMDSYVEKQIAFAAMASHELRSPLTIVQTSADLIASRFDDPNINIHLEKIQRASANMANMVDALLSVTRDQPTREALQRINLSLLIDDIVKTMGQEVCAKKISIENKLAADISITVDRSLITAVLTNLIRNAVKHSEQSSIIIDIVASVLSITDNGIGIHEEDLHHIFDFKYRGQKSQGYGVGLYLSKLICEHQGWSLDLVANPGGGVVAKIDFELTNR